MHAYNPQLGEGEWGDKENLLYGTEGDAPLSGSKLSFRTS